MLANFESILPIFLLIVAGNVVRRIRLVDADAWPGLEKLGYFLLYPALLFVTILNADFAGLEIDAMMAALLVTVFLMSGLTYALWPLLSRWSLVTAGEFSSVFQTTVRWNGFIALAIAQKLFPPAGMAVVALAMAVIIIPINVISVFVVTRFSDRSINWKRVLRALVTNPLILPCVAAVAFRSLGVPLYGPVEQALKLAGEAAIGLSLLMIGAALQLRHIFEPRLPLLLPIFLKLLAFPLILLGVATWFGVTGDDLVYLTLCAAVPTATNGYLLARQYGGDAELYAAVATAQTVASFLTMPLMLMLAAQLAAG